ncbi:DUF655 domain-containing protein [Candidatus Woesearchaeota archaeon]|nr:DUF655 domain-containing protein [Candidatus Woesearchaeota archaeon]
METIRKTREETAIVLDYLPNGYSFDKRPSHKKTAIAQVIGKQRFSLLEVVPKKEIMLQPNEEVYIGDGKREKIHHVLGKLPYTKLTNSAKAEVEYIVKDLVEANQAQFINFFNNSQALSTRMHQLELLPGLGKKHMWEILDERKEQEFSTFEDLKSRVKLMPDPKKAIIKRIILELEGNEKYRLFTE